MKKTNKKVRIVRHSGIILSFFLMLIIGGCDGCGCVNVDSDNSVNNSSKSGRIVVELTDLASLAPANGTSVITVSYSGNRTSGNSEGTGSLSFETERNYEISSDNIPSPTLERVNLRPGQWEVVVKVNSWRGSCTGTVQSDAGTRYVFKYNTNNCSH